MKRNPIPASSIFALLWVLLLAMTCSFATLAQKKRTPRKAAATAKPTPTPAVDWPAQGAQVAEQIRLVSRFVYVYGKIANSLEVAEEQARQGNVAPAVAAKNQQSKDAVVGNIRNLRAGLEGLAESFRANPRLQVQYLKLSYAAEAVVAAERLAAAGRYDEAGKSLVTAVERLTDALLALR